MRILTKDLTSKIGETVTVKGWVHSRRDHGGLIFVDLRDHSGLAQLVFHPDKAETFQAAESLRDEFVISASGRIVERAAALKNPKIVSGDVEIIVEELTILNRSETLPIQPFAENQAGEELRLKYRYLDLRRPKMQNMLKRRAEMMKYMREFMESQDFLEVHTPILASSSPEGARDFLIPSRLRPGEFYALPQAPQQFKQLLMVGGVPRYYQFAACFRDEDPRADRLYGEFYQLDLEMSFVDDGEIVRETMEPLIVDLVQNFGGKKLVNTYNNFSELKFVIIHGTGANPDSNWFPWLKKELENRGAQVFVPEMPIGEKQNLENWFETLREKTPFEFDKNTVLIGHSCGAAHILSILNMEREEPVRAAILVSGFYGDLPKNPEIDDYIKTFINLDFDWNLIKKNAEKIIQFHGEKDSYVPISHARDLAKKIDLELIEVKNGDHLGSSLTEFHELLQKILHEFDHRIPRIPYAEAMEKYGTDKPDLRYGMELVDLTDTLKNSEFKVFQTECVKAICVKNGADLSRSQIDNFTEIAKSEGAGGLAYLTYKDGEIQSPIAKFLSETELAEITKLTGASDGDAVFFGADLRGKVNAILGRLRSEFANHFNLKDPNVVALAWIVDFPFYELDEKTGKLDFGHNPFSMPKGGARALDETENKLEILADQYDMVMNGYEICSGGVRNHNPEVLYKVFGLLDFSPEYVEEKFGALLNAFKFGAPPHAGCAYGVDRMFMELMGESNIREVIAFPKNGSGQDVMMQSPAAVDPAQLDELSLRNLEKIKNC